VEQNDHQAGSRSSGPDLRSANGMVVREDVSPGFTVSTRPVAMTRTGQVQVAVPVYQIIFCSAQTQKNRRIFETIL
jgi:hypothetical protein